MKIYHKNIAAYNAKALNLLKLLNKISWLRLLVFIISSTTLITLFSSNLITPVFIVFPVSGVCFALVIKYHNKIDYLRKHTSFLKRINELEILREKCTLEEFETGDQFINQNHQYTSDLDIFGQHSVYQLINRTTTESGRICLAHWLSAPAPNDEIRNRQKAIKELSQKLEWRQEFQASGMHFHNNQSDYYKLLDWLEKPIVLLSHKVIYLVLAILFPFLLILGFYFFLNNLTSLVGIVYLSLTIFGWFFGYMILRKVRPLAEDIVENSTKNLKTLRAYRTLINKIENENFSSQKLVKLQSSLAKDKYSAYNEINKLCRLLDFSNQRPLKKQPINGNQLYPILNSFLLIDIHLIIGTEKWKSKNSAFLKSWAETVSEFEVINSFAGFCYSNPSYTFPEIIEKNNYVHFELLGHPLINTNNRVCNNFHSDTHSDVVLITGSNMAGKSTFLRTVGVNLVLALAGAPCCAINGQVSNLKIFTSMRTQDNLEKGISSFYAELNRIEEMLKLIEKNQNIFFLLDEMFKGTNSEDRHKGGFSLINQVSKLKTSGIIATHDIELAKLCENKKLVQNYSFNSEIINDSMLFNYNLHKGICYDFNASELMKKSGIEILQNISDHRN